MMKRKNVMKVDLVMNAEIVLPIVGIKKGVELIPDDVPPFRIKVHNDLRQRDFQLCRVVKKLRF